ncbi:Polyisoprenoid-binding protein YceI [Andreprevotia lacus DSM 23236]|jgi:polyisoprenoid-binding protein YceI|uniref:Polyisoprenoid-binding protein YceI n=1 Tax=Andreprevotia lacus DSM 23236 TaxID=1121001 RepID=A0A1W1XR10_9NEIS|nr:YceI family protein [Andreprevotia lacus]SMC26317.1 Polyisoprenoid-binding protein YceI [Andreprevotia lacus DSM 23236]
MKTLITLAVASLLTLPAYAAQTLNTGKSSLTFNFKQMGVPTDGRFKAFGANVAFDAAKPEATKAEFTVDLASVDVGSSDGNNAAKGKAFFNTIAGPAKATFVAKSVKALGGGKFEARGPLTIKGITKDIVSQFTAKTAGDETTLEGSFPVLRLQYKVGDGDWDDTEALADAVTVKYKFVLNGK